MAVFDPEVYGDPVYSDLLPDAVVYGEVPLSDAAPVSGTASAGVASGTGSAGAASASIAASSGAGSSTGSASAPVASVGGAAGHGSGTGASGGPTASVAASVGAATGSGSALDAVASDATFASASAGVASGSGSAFGATTTVAGSSGAASGTGASGGPSSSVSASAGASSGSGSAFGATVTTSVSASAGAATGTGSAPGAHDSLSVGPRFAANGYTSVVAGLSPITYSHLADTNGSTFTDIIRSGLQYIWSSGGGSFGVAGALSPDTKAVSMSGGFPFIPVPGSPLRLGNGPMTLMAWIHPTGVSGTQSIISKQGGSYYFRLNNNKLQLVRSQQLDIGLSTTSIVAGVWTHVALVYDGSNGPFRFYVNGVADADLNADPNFVDNASDLQIGADQGNEKFTGSLSDVAIWGRALSGAEVSAVYASRNDPPQPAGITATGRARDAQPVAGAAAFVGSSSNSSWPAVSSLSTSRPGTVAVGDTLLIGVLTDSGASVAVASTGFGAIFNHTYPDGSRSVVLQKLADASDVTATSYVVTVSPSTGMNVVMTSWRNAVVSGSDAASLVTNTAPYDQITTGSAVAAADDLALLFFHSSSFGPGAMSAPAGYATIVDRQDFFVQQMVAYGSTSPGSVPAATTSILNPDSGSPYRLGLMMLAHRVTPAAHPGAGLGTGTAYDAHVTTTPSPAPGAGSGTGTAYDAHGAPVDGVVPGAGLDYHGASQAIHADTWDSATTPTGQQDATQELYGGTAPKITSHADSPPQWDDSTVVGAMFENDLGVYYRGRSQAIHVYGVPVSVGPQPKPVPACKCCESADSGVSTGTLEDLFPRTVTAGWGVSPIDDLPWNPSAPELFSVTSGAAACAGSASISAITLGLPADASTTPFEMTATVTIPSGSDGYVMSLFCEGFDGDEFDFLDLYRESGGQLGVDLFGEHVGGGFDEDTVHSVMTGYAGVPLKMKIRIDADMSLHGKVWKASDSEPGSWTASLALDGTSVSPMKIVGFRFGSGSGAITVSEFSISAGWAVGGSWVGGSVSQTYYYVSNPSINHAGDSQWHEPSGWRYNVSNNGHFGGVTPFNCESEGMSLGAGADWSRTGDLHAAGDPGFEQRNWISVGGVAEGGTHTRVKVDYGSSYGRQGSASSAVQVGLFAFSRPGPGSFPGSAVDIAYNPLLSLHPYAIIEAGQWFDPKGQIVQISAEGLSYDTAVGQIYFANPDPGFATGYYPHFDSQYGGDGNVYGYGNSANNGGALTYEPYVITVETTSGATWTIAAATGPALGDCTDPVAVTSDSIDDFARLHSTPIPGKLVFTWGFGLIDPDKSHTLAQLDRKSYVLDEIEAFGLSPWESIWETNSGRKPVRPDIFTSPVTYVSSGIQGDPDPLIGWHDASQSTHYDWETRQTAGFRFRGSSYPANLTTVGFFQADQVSNHPITVIRDANLAAVKESVFQIRGGDIPATGLGGSGVSWDMCGVVAEVRLPIGVDTVTGDVSWAPPGGSPDFYSALSGDLDHGLGRKYTRTQDTVTDIDFVPGLSLTDRFPKDLYTLNAEWFDILGHFHQGWSANESSEFVGLYSGSLFSVPRYTFLYEQSPGWGAGPVVDWDLWDSNGDDWTQAVTVEDYHGVLRIQPSPISGVTGYAESTSNTRLNAPLDYTFTARYNYPSPSFGTVDDAFRDGVNSSFLNIIQVYPGDDKIEIANAFGPTALTLGIDWLQEVRFRLKVDSTGVYLKVWQTADEPTAWSYTETTDPFYQYDDGPAFFPFFTLEGVDATTHQILYIGALPGTGTTSVTCSACDDPANPGVPIPPFTPGYLPTFRRQIGDPTTSLDGFICTLESAAMVLDWHTRGAVKVWGGELIPWCGKTEAEIIGHGTSLSNAQQAWTHWGQHLDIRSGQTWADLMTALGEGRAVVLQGDYGEFSLSERCQTNFEDNHAISIYPYEQSGRLLVGDPLCHDFKGFLETSLQAYAEALGRAVFGATSPQKILFAVSRAWTP